MTSADTSMFGNLLEAVPDALVGVDRSGLIRFVNHQTESLFGYGRDDLVGAPLETLVPEGLRQVHAAHREGFTAAPRTRLMGTELRLNARRRDGTEFPVDIALSPMETAEGMLVVAAVRDMSQHRMAEAVRRRLDRLSAVVEFSGEAIISSSLDGIVTSWNPAAERLYGYSGEEMIGKSILQLSPENRHREISSILARTRAGQTVENFETIYVRRNGTVFPASLTVSPIRDEDSEIIGASTIAHDVTKQKGASELSRSMIEASLDPMVTISPEGQITDVNEATVKLTGVPRDKLIGTPFSGYFTDPEKAEEIYQLVFTEGMAVDYPLTLRHRDGHETLIDVLYNATVYRDASGAVLGVFAAARDVTQQKQAAQYARSLIEAALDPMVTISPEGQITDVNEATVRATGVPRDKLIGTSFSDYFTDPEKANEGYQRVFEQGSVTDYPLTLRRRNGQETYTEVLYNASVYGDTRGNVLGVFASARDVTKQIQAQKEVARQQARELERLAELEQFQRLTVGRELKMIELKKEIEYLRKSGPAHEGDPGDQR